MEYPSMYHAAVEYIKLGLAVFPLEKNGKKPITKNGCKDATLDAAQVKAWWQEPSRCKYRNCNGEPERRYFCN